MNFPRLSMSMTVHYKEILQQEYSPSSAMAVEESVAMLMTALTL